MEHTPTRFEKIKIVSLARLNHVRQHYLADQREQKKYSEMSLIGIWYPWLSALPGNFPYQVPLMNLLQIQSHLHIPPTHVPTLQQKWRHAWQQAAPIFQLLEVLQSARIGQPTPDPHHFGLPHPNPPYPTPWTKHHQSLSSPNQLLEETICEK